MITDISKWDFVDQDQYEEDYDEDFDEQQDDILSEEQREQRKQKAKAEALQKNNERFYNFYREFGKAVKLGVMEDKNNRNKLASLTRWYTTRNSTELTSLDDYISRMKSVQDQIYFFSG